MLGKFSLQEHTFEGEWRAVEGSRYFQSPLLYKENGFKKREDAVTLCRLLTANPPWQAIVEKIERKKENKNPPLLFNLAELQNECSRLFKLSPDETLKIVQELYEKKLVTYPRTDARVLSTAVAKEIYKNLSGLGNYEHGSAFAREILAGTAYKEIAKTRYVNDKQITDHYAIIPTGQGIGALKSLSGQGEKVYEVIVRRFLSIFYPPAVYQKINTRYVNDKQITDHYAIIPTGQGLGALKSLSGQGEKVYEVIVRRFLSIFYPPAVYQKINLTSVIEKERLFSSFKVLVSEGYLKVTSYSFGKKKEEESGKEEEQTADQTLLETLQNLKKGSVLPVEKFTIKEGETSPPKRYTSGSMILAMENAGQLIEDEELRAQIKGSGIGTSATRAEILKKLVTIKYLALNKKTQVITPTLLGEMIFDVVNASIRSGIGTSATRAEILKKLVTIKYLALNKKTQVITPTLLGEMIFDVVNASIRSLLNPELTASWEKGLTYVAEGTITPEEYMVKLENFIRSRTEGVMGLHNQLALKQFFDADAVYYQKTTRTSGKKVKKS